MVDLKRLHAILNFSAYVLCITYGCTTRTVYEQTKDYNFK